MYSLLRSWSVSHDCIGPSLASLSLTCREGLLGQFVARFRVRDVIGCFTDGWVTWLHCVIVDVKTC